jgi:ligand-binding sensor domain-containing protein
MFYTKNPNTSLKPYGLYTIYKDRKGYMWFGTASLGVCRYDGRALSWHYEEQLQTTPHGGDFGTRAIFEDKNGKFWINNTRFRYVIEKYGNKSVTFKKESGIGYLNKTNKMEFPFFLSITEDNKGNLWMATYENGVWKYNGKELIHFPIKDGETNVLLFTIYKDNKGVLWLGTHNAGVYTFNGHSFEKFVQ